MFGVHKELSRRGAKYEDFPLIKYYKDSEDKEEFLREVIFEAYDVKRSVFFLTRLIEWADSQKEFIVRQVVENSTDEFIFTLLLQLALMDNDILGMFEDKSLDVEEDFEENSSKSIESFATNKFSGMRLQKILANIELVKRKIKR